MKYAKMLLVAVLLAAVSLPQAADGQLRRLKERAKDRAQERLTQHAEKKVDEAVDHVVDESVQRTENLVNNWIKDAFSGDASVSEDGVLSRDGKEDVKLQPNESGPANAEYLSYIQISTIKVPGFTAFGGMTTASEFYLHKNKSATEDASTLSVMDLDGRRMLLADHKEKSYWQQTFAEMTEMVGAVMDDLEESMEDAEEDASDVVADAEKEMEDSNVEMDFSFSVDDTGITETVNGLPARRYIYTIETTITGETDEGKQSTKFYTITDAYVTPDFAGSETMKAFQVRMMEAMGAEAMASSLTEKMQGLSFLDARIGDSMKKSAEEMAKVDGLPVKTVTYMVSVPENKQLNRDMVFSESDASSPDSQPGDEQRTILITTTYFSNLTGDAFDQSKTEVPASYKEVESPMVKYKRMMEAQADKKTN